MISNPPIVSNIWKACAGAWFIGFGFISMFFWIIPEQLGQDSAVWEVLAWIWICGSIALLAIGLLWKEGRRRVLIVVSIATLFGYLPVIALCAVFGFSFLFLFSPDESAKFLLAVSMSIGITFWWCFREVRRFAKLISERRFIEREFDVDEDHVVLSRPHRTSLDLPPIPQNTLMGGLYYRFAPRLVMLIPIAYPLQRLLTGAGGTPAVLLFLSVLAAPLAIHGLGRLSCGAYLYGYKVWQLEKRHCKPVVFEHA